jgi:hypothetical protein
VITKPAILDALKELIAYEEGFRFQDLGVILAKKKCPELKANEPKSDLGLDAYAAGELFENGMARGAACSNTATLTKIRSDIGTALPNFKDLKILFFVTPVAVREKTAKGWREKIKKDYGITLIVMSRQEVVSELLRPENASLCGSILRIPVPIEASLEQIADDCRAGIAEVNAWWRPRVDRAPLIDLSTDQLGIRGNDSGTILQLVDLQEMLVRSHRVLLEAPAGRGKTTTLTQIGERCTATGNMAFIVDLPSWSQSGEDILEFIAGMRPFRARSIDATKLAKLYESQHFIFLLNGWNEVAESDSGRALVALGALERQYPDAGILVATRTHWMKPPLPGTTVRARLRLLTQRQRADYVIARLGDEANPAIRQIHSSPALDELTLTPLFLSEVVSIAGAGREIPGTKMGVLREVVQLPETDPMHRGALDNAPLFSQADIFLTALAAWMTVSGQTQALESAARGVMNEKLRQIHEAGDTAGTATGQQILAALADHHVLERIDYPTAAYRFEHQQMQEYYAAESVMQELLGIVLAAELNQSLDVIATTNAAKSFQSDRVNQSSWSEPLSMVAGDRAEEAESIGSNRQLILAKALLVLLALDVDVIFAAELFGLASPEVQTLVTEKLGGAIGKLWNSPEKHVRSRALAAMVATRSEMFKNELLPLLRGEGENSRFEVYRSDLTFRLSSLGPNWQQEVRTWNEKARLTFVSEMFHIAGPLREMAAFALGDPSLEVRTRAFSDLMWMNTDDETTRILMDVDEATFEAAVERVPLRNTHPIFRARALQVYRRVLAQSSNPAKRFMAAGNAVLFGQLDAHEALKECLDHCTTEQVRQMDQRELRPLLDALSLDQAWRSRWITRRVLEGALDAERWNTLMDPLDDAQKEQLLQRIENEDLSYGRGPGVQSLLRLNADTQMAQRVFLRIVELHRTITSVNAVRSEENLARAPKLGELKGKLERFLRKFPAQVMVDGVLSVLSAEFNLDELRVLADLWGWGTDDDGDPHEVLSEPSLQAARMYLKDAVPRLTNDSDPRGEVRAHLAVAISRFGEPEDMAEIAALLESEIGRIRAAQAARAARDSGPLANGSAMRYTNQYMLAVRQLESQSEGPFLDRLLAEPECERDVAWALVEWAFERSLPTNVWMDAWANRPREFREIWEARSSSKVARFDESRRKAAVGYLRAHIDSLRSRLSTEAPDPQMVWRLKDLMKPLATLDGRASAPLILEILALPLQTHGTMDGWKRVQPLEIMLFEGAALPNEQTLAIIMPVVDELTSKWHSDNERSLLSMSLIILPFLEDAQAGIAILAELAEQVGLSYEGIRRVVSALGHSRCDNALDVLLAIGTKDGRANSLGEVWINAVAELDTQSARDVLMSFIDPESSEGLAAASLGRNDVLAQRIAEIAEKNPSIRARLLGLCGVRLDRARRELLGSVIVRLGDEHPPLQGADIDAVTKMLGRKCVAELVEKEPLAVRAICTTIAMLGHALAAVEPGPICDLFDDLDVQAVWLSLGVGENRLRESRVALLLELPELLDQRRRDRHRTFFVVLGLEFPDRLGSNAHHAVAEVDVSPGHVANFAVAEAGRKAKLDEDRLIRICMLQHRGDLLGLVNGADGFDITWPVAALDQILVSVTLEELEDDDKPVVDGARDQTVVEKVAHEFEDVAAVNLVDVGFRV